MHAVVNCSATRQLHVRGVVGPWGLSGTSWRTLLPGYALFVLSYCIRKKKGMEVVVNREENLQTYD